MLIVKNIDISLDCVVDHIHTHYALKVYLVFIFDEDLEKHVLKKYCFEIQFLS